MHDIHDVLFSCASYLFPSSDPAQNHPTSAAQDVASLRHTNEYVCLSHIHVKGVVLSPYVY